MSKSTKQIRVEKTLNRSIDEADFELLYDAWRAFCEDPEQYSNTIVTAMVNLYLDTIVGEDPLNCEGY